MRLIRNDGHGVYLTTDRDFGDCEFWIDYKTVPQADSGIYLRGTPQVQIWDTIEAGGKWKIGKVSQFMDGSQHPGKDLTSGHFGFAGHHDPVAFRKIEIKRLD